MNAVAEEKKKIFKLIQPCTWIYSLLSSECHVKFRISCEIREAQVEIFGIYWILISRERFFTTLLNILNIYTHILKFFQKSYFQPGIWDRLIKRSFNSKSWKLFSVLLSLLFKYRFFCIESASSRPHHATYWKKIAHQKTLHLKYVLLKKKSGLPNSGIAKIHKKLFWQVQKTLINWKVKICRFRQGEKFPFCFGGAYTLQFKYI